MSCDSKTDEFIKNIIYKNKVVVFGFSNDEHTNKVINFFKEKFNHNSQNIFLDGYSKLNDDIKIDNLEVCLTKRTKNNKVPMVYLNGMYLGGWRSIENMDYRKDLDIFF